MVVPMGMKKKLWRIRSIRPSRFFGVLLLLSYIYTHNIFLNIMAGLFKTRCSL